jgi:hypothetical protein
MSLADERRTRVGKPLECRRNGEKDHEASGLEVARAERAEVRRGITATTLADIG